jgi:hypothetical protein
MTIVLVPWTKGIFLFIYRARLERSPLVLRPLVGLSYQSWVIDGDDCGAIAKMND